MNRIIVLYSSFQFAWPYNVQFAWSHIECIYISTLAFYAVFGRSIVVNGRQSSQIIGCARINTEPSVDLQHVKPIHVTFSSKGTKLEDISRCAQITNCV